MNQTVIQKKFAQMGADVVVNPPVRSIFGGQRNPDGYSLDVRKGEFIINFGENIDVSIVDVDVKDRHLLVNVTESPKRAGLPAAKHKFICGHDERDWFVAAVPEVHHWVKNVKEAKQALKPNEVRESEKGLTGKDKFKRKNKARIRQGEWFFIPVGDLKVKQGMIHKNEPLSRGMGSKPHMVDEIYREGGVTVRVSSQGYQSGITEGEYKKLVKKDPSKAKLNWTTMTRDAVVYARGCVRHKDHATIVLNGWHRVLMNTEGLASSRRNVAFLD